MLNPNFKRAARSSARPVPPSSQTRTICIVDPQADDYEGWEASAHANGVRLHIVASGEEALRVARTLAIDLWVVNIDLPGLSGGELCSMLRSHGRSPIFLVADQYSPAVERAAWQARPTLIGCKGDHHQWLDHWLTVPRPRPHGDSPGPAPHRATVVR